MTKKTPQRPEDLLLIDIKALAMANRRSGLAGMARRYLAEGAGKKPGEAIAARQEKVGRDSNRTEFCPLLLPEVVKN